MNTKEKITKISEIFFIEEPLLFIAFCSHTIVSNVFIKTIRSGNKKIEYNPEFIKSLSFEETKEYLKFELIRILLKHPYQRKKDHPVCSFLASQIVITQYFSFQNKFFDIQLIFENPFFDRFESFEFYYNELVKSIKNSESDLPGINPRVDENSKQAGDLSLPEFDKDDGKYEEKKSKQNRIKIEGLEIEISPKAISEIEDNSELWGEDELFNEELNTKISNDIIERKYGTLPSNLVALIQKTIIHKLDYMNILKTFRKDLLSSNSELTRRKLNRRYGSQYMGRRNVFSTNLLIAFDTSGSISEDELVLAFSIIKRIFKYGIKSLSYVTFDTEINEVKKNVNKSISKLEFEGRGGTNFQCVFDYLKINKGYNAVIIITDGFAPIPDTYGVSRNKILFILNNKRNYDLLDDGFRKLGRCVWVE